MYMKYMKHLMLTRNVNGDFTHEPFQRITAIDLIRDKVALVLT